jgi:hypothetical protein
MCAHWGYVCVVEHPIGDRPDPPAPVDLPEDRRHGYVKRAR